MRRPTLRPRPRRSIPAIVVCLALLALGGLAVWTGVQRLAVGSWPVVWSWAARVTGQHWASPAIIAIAAVGCLLGLVLLLAAVLPGTPAAFAVGTADDRHETVVTRAGVARLVTSAAAEVSGVDGVSTSVGSRRVSVRVSTESRNGDDVSRRVADEVGSRLGRLGVQPPLRVDVVARTSERRA